MNDAAAPPAILLTGGSRGVGAATVLALTARGATVIFSYREKLARAQAVAEQAGPGRAYPVQADITVPADRERLVSAVRGQATRLSALVLNASGGMERDRLEADPDFPMRLNRDAQVALVELALPLLIGGGVVVFVTSHWAHFYGETPTPAAYEAVAASKHAGEAALRERAPAMAEHGVRLAVVSGDVIEGTITPRLLERAQPGLLEHRRRQVQRLPTTEDMAAAIVQCIEDRTLPSGHTVYVGSTEAFA